MIEFTPLNLLIMAGVLVLVAIIFVICIRRELK